MNIDLHFWWSALGTIAAEVAVIVVIAFIAQKLTRSATWMRTWWQIALVCSLLVSIAEFSGVGRGLALWAWGKKPIGRRISITLPAQTAQARPINPPLVFETPTIEAISEEIVAAPTNIWWPAYAWLAGLIIVLGRVTFVRVLLANLHSKKSTNVDDHIQQRAIALATQFGLRQGLTLTVLGSIRTPIAFGIVRARIGLPLDFTDRFTETQQDAMLAHEIAHLKNRDPFWYLVIDLVTAVLWWHPLIWFARRRFHRTSELLADEATIAIENGPATLAECLVNIGRELSSSTSFGLLGIDGGFRSPLAQRVQRLLKLPSKNGQPSPAKHLALRPVAAIVLAAVVITTTGWVQTKNSVRKATLADNVLAGWNDSSAALALEAVKAEQSAPKELEEQKVATRDGLIHPTNPKKLVIPKITTPENPNQAVPQSGGIETDLIYPTLPAKPLFKRANAEQLD